jgi:hypothetical protein
LGGLLRRSGQLELGAVGRTGAFLASIGAEELVSELLRNIIEQNHPATSYRINIIVQDQHHDEDKLQIEGFKLHLNSVGRKGKGLGVYYKDKIVAIGQTYNDKNRQISTMKRRELCVIGLYRSAADTTLSNSLRTIIPAVGPMIVTGDFNICLARSPEHEVFKTLRTMGFKPLITEATHFTGGHIDQAWLRDMGSTVQLYSPYYTCRDHDALLISVFDRRTEQGECSNYNMVFVIIMFFVIRMCSGTAESLPPAGFKPPKRTKKRRSHCSWDTEGGKKQRT